MGWARGRRWVRTPALVYSVHVLTSMLPIMAELLADPRPSLVCLSTYAVWVLLPCLMLARCLAAGDGGDLFAGARAGGKAPKARQ